jgi:hypothetical protein
MNPLLQFRNKNRRARSLQFQMFAQKFRPRSVGRVETLVNDLARVGVAEFDPPLTGSLEDGSHGVCWSSGAGNSVRKVACAGHTRLKNRAHALGGDGAGVGSAWSESLNTSIFPTKEELRSQDLNLGSRSAGL